MIFTKIKLIIGAAIGVAFAVLLGWIKIVQAQKKAAELEARNQKAAADSYKEKAKISNQIKEVVDKTREKANEIEKQNEDRRDDDDSRPSGSFGDPRL